MSDFLAVIITGIGMISGLVFVFLPVLPDIILIWLSALGYGLLTGWGEGAGFWFGLISVMGLVGILADILLGGAGARLGGAALRSVLLGFLLGAVGLIAGGPAGGVIGWLVGIFVLEVQRHDDVGKAIRAIFGIGLGMGASLAVKFLLGLGMIAAWIVWVFLV